MISKSVKLSSPLDVGSLPPMSIIMCALFMVFFSITIVTGLFVLQNNAVDQDQRGAANGIAMTGMSLFKALGPATGGIVFSWAQKRRDASFLPGSQMIFFILNVIEVLGLLLTFKPFLVQRHEYNTLS